MAIYKLLDLMNIIDLEKCNGEFLLSKPIGVNYYVQNVGIIKQIVQISNTLVSSSYPLVDHLRLIGVSAECYIKLKEKDVDIIQILLRNSCDTLDTINI